MTGLGRHVSNRGQCPHQDGIELAHSAWMFGTWRISGRLFQVCSNVQVRPTLISMLSVYIEIICIYIYII